MLFSLLIFVIGFFIEWMKVRGKYWNIAATNVSSACPRSPNGVSPHCHLGDGSIDLVLVKHGSIFNNLRMLLTVSGKKKSVVSKILWYYLFIVPIWISPRVRSQIFKITILYCLTQSEAPLIFFILSWQEAYTLYMLSGVCIVIFPPCLTCSTR